MSEESKNRSHSIYLILILLLIGGLIYTLLQLKKTKDEYTVMSTEKNYVETLYSNLETEYQRSLDDIDALKGENVKLDSILSVREKEIKNMKGRISALITKENATKAELNQAEFLIRQFGNERLAYQARIDSLSQKYIELQKENLTLTQEKEIIQTTLAEERQTANTTSLANKEMINRIEEASILTTRNLNGSAIRLKNNGREVTVNKASQAEKLKICFDLLENKIAPKGETEIDVRVIGPDGSTIAVQALGSGSFEDEISGEEIQYTYKIRPDFQGETKTVCSYWAYNAELVGGDYKIMLYQNGRFIGETAFDLN